MIRQLVAALCTDPNCCPSREKLDLFLWDSRKGTFTLRSTSIRKTRRAG